MAPTSTVPVFYSPDYTLAGHTFGTTRKARWVADSIEREPIDGIEVRAPELLSEADLLAAHDAAYVTAIRTGEPRDLAETNKFTWDAALWTAVRASNGGAFAAAVAAVSTGGVAGSLSSGLHHAKAGRGDGYCTFNGLALAARRVLDDGAKRVLIIDLDAHCGGGTFQILGQDERVSSVDVAVDAFDHHTGRDGWTLDLVDQSADYVPTIRRRLESIEGDPFDLVIYNAGMDPYEKCAIGGLAGITGDVLAERETLVFDWCAGRRLPVAFVLAGGYVSPGFERVDLVNLHRLTLEAAAAAIIPS